MSKYTAEFVGTFFLMLSVVACINSNIALFAPIAVAGVLVGMIYALGHVSKAHFNPIITLGFWIRKQITPKDITGYVLAQFAGAILAVLISKYLLEIDPLVQAQELYELKQSSVLKGFTAEFLGAFALYIVVMMVASTKSLAGNSFYGIAIAFTVLGMAYTVGGFGTFACFNPSVSLGLLIHENITLNTALISIAAQFIAALIAAFTMKIIYPFKE